MPNPVVLSDLNEVEPDELIDEKQGDEELTPCFPKVGEGSEEMEGREEFVLQKKIFYCRWREVDGGELLQMVVLSKFREVLMLLAHEGPMVGHLGIRKTVARLGTRQYGRYCCYHS